MKVTYLKQTQTFQGQSTASYAKLQAEITKRFANLPSQFCLVSLPQKNSSSIRSEEEFQKFMKKIEGKAEFQIQKLEGEPKLEEIVSDEENEKEEKLDEIICNKLEKILPGILTKVMREDIMEKSEEKNDPASHFNMKKKLKNFVYKLIQNQIDEYERMAQKIFRQVRTLEEAHQLQNYLEEDFAYFLDEMEKEKKIIAELCSILSEKTGSLTLLSEKYEEFQKEKEKMLISIKKKKTQFEKELGSEQKQFRGMLQKMKEKIIKLKQKINERNYEEMMNLSSNLNGQIQAFQSKTLLFNRREQILGLKTTDYPELDEWRKEVQILSCYWEVRNLWCVSEKRWKTQPLQKLQYPYISSNLQNFSKKISYVLKEQQNQEIQKQSKKIKEEIDNFKTFLPLLEALLANGMNKKHWEEIELISSTISSPQHNLQKMLKLNLLNNLEECQKISQKAQKEYKIREKLNKINSHWKHCKFEIQNLKKDVFVISNIQDLYEYIDEHLRSITQIQKSTFADSAEDELRKWKQDLTQMSNVLDDMNNFVARWRYFSNIMISSLNMKEKKGEEEFKKVSAICQEILNIIELSKTVHSACLSKDLISKLESCSQSMNCVQKMMTEFLEKKRKIFPRLYFISNDEMLQMQQEKKLPIQKCFENIHNLEKNGNDDITHLISREGLKLKLSKPLSQKNKEIQVILKQIEDMMRISVRDNIEKALTSYGKTKRGEWIKNNIDQCVFTASQIMWTDEAEKAMRQNKMGERTKNIVKQTEELIKMTRENLTKIERTRVNSLMKFLIFERDMSYSLSETQANDFSWEIKMRQYWIDNQSHIQCFNHRVMNRYEFLGNLQFLIMTPLTHKAYISNFHALKSGYGYCPQGPAGTGKTQTVKDLGRVLGQQVVILNASDGIDYIMMEKFFTGIVQSGCWTCIDEFNRIDEEVLSVIAEQIQTLSQAKHKKTCIFGGKQIAVNPNFFISFTMNPGYAGRSQLPPSIMNQFRPIVFILPDWRVICKGQLSSFGFIEADKLGFKITTVFQSCSQLLSRQDHYDFGLRPVMHTLRLAREIKQRQPETDDDLVVALALKRVLSAKFFPNDLILFEGILQEVFPEVKIPQLSYFMQKTKIKSACQQHNVEPNEFTVEKILQIFDTLTFRHGNILIGESGTGKSTALKVASKVQGRKIKTDVFNPKSITMDELYGKYSHEDGQWRDGYIAKVWKEWANDTQSDEQWLIFDGPIDALWIQSLNSTLDDNKKLCLNSGQVLFLSRKMRLIFEVEDLAVASPATVSRNGVVNFPPSSFNIESLFISWKKILSEEIKQNEKLFQNLAILFKEYGIECVEFANSCQKMVLSSRTHLVMCLLNILESKLNEYQKTKLLDEFQNHTLEVFIWCLICSVGNVVESENRKNFNEFLRNLCLQKMKKILPEKGSVYDYYYDLKLHCWVPWNESSENWEIDHRKHIHEIIVPTKDLISTKTVTKLLLNNNFSTLLAGPMHSGKSLVSSMIISQPKYETSQIQFSLFTSVKYVRDGLQSIVEKKSGRNFGPAKGKVGLLYIDDINFPKKEVYGAQPPLEFLRYLMEEKKILDEKIQAKNIENVIITASLCTNNLTRITRRLVTKFNVVGCPEPENEILTTIFENVFYAKMKKYPETIRSMKEQISEACIKVLNLAKKSFDPSSQELHRPFTFKDAWKVIQSICEVNPQQIKNPEEMANLFYQENMKIFSERLSSLKCRDILRKGIEEIFKEKKLYSKSFQNISCPNYLVASNKDNKLYFEKADFQEVLEKTENCINSYNNEADEKNKLCIGVCQEFCQNIGRVYSCVKYPGGNALILGRNSCCGRRAIVKIASYIMGYKFKEIQTNPKADMNKWNESMKQNFFSIISSNTEHCLVVYPSQFSEQMLASFNKMLKVNNLYDLWNEEDCERLSKIMNVEHPELKKRENIFRMAHENLRNNLHFVICMNSQSDDFQKNIKQFPSLLNETTAFWLENWTQDCLFAIGKKVLPEELMNKKIISVCSYIHASVQDTQKDNLDSRFSSSWFLQFVQMYRKLSTEFLKESNECKKMTEKENEMLQKLQKQLKQTIQETKKSLLTNKSEKLTSKVEKCEQIFEMAEKKKNTNHKNMKNTPQNISGNTILNIAVTIYGGLFQTKKLQELKTLWRNKMKEHQIDTNTEEIFSSSEDYVYTQQNFKILLDGPRLPLFVDPKSQIRRVVKRYTSERQQQFIILNETENEKQIMQKIQNQNQKCSTICQFS